MRSVKSLADVQIVLRDLLGWRDNPVARANSDQKGYQLKNAGDATDPQDYVTLSQTQSLIGDATAQANAAIAKVGKNAGAPVSVSSGFVLPPALITANGLRQFLVEDITQKVSFSTLITSDLPLLGSYSVTLARLTRPTPNTQFFPAAGGVPAIPPLGLYSFNIYVVVGINAPGVIVNVTPLLIWQDFSAFIFSTQCATVTTSSVGFNSVSFPIVLSGGQMPTLSVSISGNGTYSVFASLMRLS